MHENPSLNDSQICYIADRRIAVDPLSRSVTADEELVEFGDKSFDILSCLARQTDRIVPHAEILEQVYDYTAQPAKRAMMNLVYYTRRKLGPELGDSRKGAIRIMKGMGYYAASTLTEQDVATPETDEGVCLIADGRIEVHAKGLAVVADGRHVDDITGTEYRLLKELAQKPGKRFGSLQLLEQCQSVGSTNIDTPRRHISRLRSKLGPELGDSKKGAIRRDRDGLFYVASSINGNNHK